MCWPQGHGVTWLAHRASRPGLRAPGGSLGPDSGSHFFCLAAVRWDPHFVWEVGADSWQCSGPWERVEKVLKANLGGGFWVSEGRPRVGRSGARAQRNGKNFSCAVYTSNLAWSPFSFHQLPQIWHSWGAQDWRLLPCGDLSSPQGSCAPDFIFWRFSAPFRSLP